MLHVAVCYSDNQCELLTVFCSEDQVAVLSDLLDAVYGGQESYVFGTALNPDTFKDDVERVISDPLNKRLSIEEVAEQLFEMVMPTEVVEGVTKIAELNRSR